MASYNKLTTLKNNIEAIKVAFDLAKGEATATATEREILQKYSGFGGLKCILSPADKPEDVAKWSKSEQHLFPHVQELHKLIRDNSCDDAEYKSYMSSLKNSVLTAFYTPRPVVDAITRAIQDAGVTPQKVLEPSAGMGEFVSSLRTIADVNSSIFSFEKDLLTGKILEALHPDARVRVQGFEEIDSRLNGYFDLVTSNIPFGDVAVFDPQFMKSEDMAHKMARQSLHNYFFVKGVDTLRDGGVLAFITSQGVMNSATNRPIREWLMNNSDLVSAVRLPNNLFSKNAGTDVGSDLVVLQKRAGKESINEDEKRFIETAPRPTSGVMWNTYFRQQSQIVYTSFETATDPYGKPAIIFKHDGGVDGIAQNLGEILSRDFKKNFNLELYNQPIHRAVEVVEPKISTPKVTVQPSPQNSLFELFGDVAAQQRPRRRTARSKPKPAEQPTLMEQSKGGDSKSYRPLTTSI